MLRIDSDKTIHLTRGDEGTITVSAKEGTSDYTFTVGQKVSLIVVPKNGYSQGSVIRKDIVVATEGTTVDIPLTDEDTKIGGMIDRAATYWYDIVIDDTQTIVGYDEDGAKKLILYPEGGEADA